MTSVRAHNPDRLAALEEERNFLLRSLTDLESEHDAGDLDDADFEQLRADYTVRAADLIRQIDQHEQAVAAGHTKRPRWITAGWIVALVVFAVAAGLLLAQGLGERGVNDQITGSLDLSPRDQFFECQMLDQQGSVSEANECYSAMLSVEPDNVEALAYKGWLLERTANSAADLGAEDEAATLRQTSQNLLDRAVAVNPDYADARAFRVIILNSRGDLEAACAEYTLFAALDPPPFMVDLVSSVVSCP